MKALVLESIERPLALRECDDPIAKAGEAVITLKAAALNRRDYFITRGMYPKIQLPVVLGSDGAGVVSSVGIGVDPRWVGREVLVDPGSDWGDNPSVHSDKFTILGLPRDGTFATHVCVPAVQLHHKPAHMNWSQAAALPLAGVTAYRALFTQGGLEAGQTILITGVGGGVATFALQFAVAAGAKVWVTSSSPDKIRQATRLGALGGFDYREPSWFKEFSQSAGAPLLIIDSAGGDGYAALINIASPGARIVNYGATAGAPEKLDLFKVFWKQLRLQGSTMGSPQDFEAMLAFVEQHRITPVIDAEFPLADGNQAIERMATSPQFGKYVIVV